MALITTLSSSDIVNMAAQYNRLDNFTSYGWRMLAEYLDDLYGDTDENIEIDIIGICCEYSHYENAHAIMVEYDTPIDIDGMDDDELHKAVIDWLHEQTSVVCSDSDCIIFASF